MFLLVGCGKGNNFTLDLGSKVIDESLNNMEVIADSTLTDAYNIDLAKMSEHVFKQNSNGDFYAIIKTDDAASVKTLMETYFQRVKELRPF